MSKIWFAVTVVLLCAIPFLGNAQSFPDENGIALKGVERFDAHASILAWGKVEYDRDQFLRQFRDEFVLGLRRDGVQVAANAPNYLICAIMAVDADGIIVYTYEVKYYLFEGSGVHKLLWEDGGIVRIGSNLFQPDDVAKDCVDKFANEWLKQNPPTGR